MRKSDYMANLRKDESQQGPLKIIKLPHASHPVILSDVTPNSLVNIGFHNSNEHVLSINKMSEHKEQRERSQNFRGINLEFHDINE